METYQFDSNLSYGFVTRYRAALSICHGTLAFVDAFKMAWSTRDKTAAKVRHFFTQKWQEGHAGSSFSYWDEKFHAKKVGTHLLSSCTTLTKEDVKKTVNDRCFREEFLPNSYRALRHFLFKKVSCDEERHLFIINDAPPNPNEMHILIGTEGLDLEYHEASFKKLAETRPVKKLLKDRAQLISILGGKRLTEGNGS